MQTDSDRTQGSGTLYKYVTADRIDVLQNSHIRFTQPSVLNDPFEMSADVTSVREEDGAVAGFAKLVLNASAHFVRPNYGDNIGVLSLTERPDNLLMWAHYAGEHSGFLIELDSQHRFFHRQTAAGDLERCLQKVTYSEERPEVGWKGYALALLTKSRQWAYEQEWRMLCPLEEADRKNDHHGVGVYLFRFPPECVRSLVLGCRMGPDQRQAFVDLVTTDERYSHVLIYHARQDPDRYGLRLTGKGSIHFGHAARELQDGNTAAAHTAIDQAIALEPDNHEYLAMRGRMKLDQDPVAARADLERSVKLHPFDSSVWALLTIATHRMNDVRGALSAIDEAIIHDRNNPEFLCYRAGLKHELGEYVSAVTDLDRAIALQPDEARYFSKRASNHKRLRHAPEVRADVERAIGLAPEVAGYRAMRAQLSEEASEWETAVREYSDAIRLDPTEPDYYLGRASNHREMKDLDAAIADLGEVIKLSGDAARPYGLRAQLYLEMGDRSAADRDAARLRELDPELFEEFFPTP